VLDRNPAYWGGASKLDRVIVSIIPDPQARVAALQSGDVDLVLEMAPDQVPVLRRDANVDVVFQPTPNVWFWMFNYRDGPTADKRVRQALNYAWNRDAMAAGLLSGLGEAALSPAPPNNPASPPSHAPYTYDPEKAKALLKEAGLGAGFELKLMFPNTTQGSLQSVPMNSQLQADFKKVGVNVIFDQLEHAAFLTESRKGLPTTHGALQTFWTTNAQLGFWLEQMFSKKFHPPQGNNRGWYASDEADQLMAAARPIADPAKSAEAYRKVLDQIVDDAPWLWVVHDKNPIALRKRVKGLDVAATPYLDLQPVSIG
jgi:peptide/nickel transport system substrate-binding protein